MRDVPSAAAGRPPKNSSWPDPIRMMGERRERIAPQGTLRGKGDFQKQFANDSGYGSWFALMPAEHVWRHRKNLQPKAETSRGSGSIHKTTGQIHAVSACIGRAQS